MSTGLRAVFLALLGYLVGGSLVGLVFQAIAAVAEGYSPTHPPQVPAVTIAGLLGLWVGLVAAVVVTSRLWGTRHPTRDFGLRLRPWPDLPLGIAVGLAGQLLLVPALYLPFRSSVPHLSRDLSREARQLTAHAHGASFVVLALFIAVGAPIVEEYFFRGLLLRSAERIFTPLGRYVAGPLAILVAGAAFGLAHLEGLLVGFGLAVFGVVLGVLARSFRRLGPGIVAHAAFNATAVVSLALVRPH